MIDYMLIVRSPGYKDSGITLEDEGMLEYVMGFEGAIKEYNESVECVEKKLEEFRKMSRDERRKIWTDRDDSEVDDFLARMENVVAMAKTAKQGYITLHF